MIAPSACRRLVSNDGWVVFFYGRVDVFGYVWDVESASERP